MEQSPFQVEWPLRIGVTGHRVLENAGAISSRVVEVLSIWIPELLRSCAEGDLRVPVRYVAVSSLADGADRLVARQVLTFNNSALEAVVPVEEEEYKKDFSSPGSAQEYADLLASAARLVRIRRGSGPATNVTAADRRKAYSAAGRYVVEHCDVLIALWDGEPARGQGGTAEVIAYARERGRPLVLIDAHPPYTISLETGKGIDCSSWEGVQRFNSAPHPEKERTYVDNLASLLLEIPSGRALPEEARVAIREVLLPAYARASLAAKGHGRLYKNAGLWIQALSAAAVAGIATGILWPRVSAAAFTMELILLLAILCLVVAVHRKGSRHHWMENRLLAERFRAAVFLRACGMAPSWMDSPACGRTQQWLSRVVADVWLRIRAPGKVCAEWQACREYLRVHWLDEQIRFHRERAEASGKALRWLERAGKILFASALGVASLHVLLMEVVPAWGGPVLADEAVWAAMSWFAVVLPAAGAALVGIRSHREYARLEDRSLWMSEALEDTRLRLDQASTVLEFEAAVRDAESLMLSENEEWYSLMRHVPLDAV